MAFIDPHWLQGLPGYQKYRESVGLPPITPQDAGMGGFFGNLGNIGVKAFTGAALGSKGNGGNSSMENLVSRGPVPEGTVGPSFWETILKNLPSILGAIPGTNPGNAPGGTTGGTATQGGTSLLPKGMEWLLPILTAIAGGLQNRESTSTSNTSATPQYSPVDEKFKNDLMAKYTDYINKDPNLQGYEANQLSAINKGYQLRATDQSSDLASRGITGPAAALAKTNLDNQRFTDTTQLRNDIPLLANQLKQQALTSASGYFNSLPYGNKVESTTKQSGNILGGGVGGFAEALAALYGIKLGRT